ncbi:PREDICTED: oxygen-evolving enhancer protein 3-2, chloroplastic-like [Nicotiana attenuata]|uniref:16 kDa subunit of oxygen evolving system of photosystem II n=1 Tax=Nicotiana attenuata TaxID=49451 RepID=A0A1J6I2Q5_NICAT|nr:PREDICTED: oxygen-evolving enhancer protein 3-2, chloroplastic-like [Nicotiana attenuata]OIS99348.1 oxygen-evolving enhancer protein 3-2, chloroplastic [Nicotiana attenuata]
MAHTVASIIGSSQAVIESSLQISGSSIPKTSRISMAARPCLSIRAQQGSAQETETSRRAILGIVAVGLVSGSFAQSAFAEARSIKIGGAPPPSGGLPGTLNSDQARDLKLPLKDRFYLQPLTPDQAAQRAKESAKDIINVKEFIDKKAWPYVQNDLRLKAEYLRYDLKTVISAKPKEEKKQLQELSGKLFMAISNLDYAAKTKNSAQAEKCYAETVSTLNDVLAKLG